MEMMPVAKFQGWGFVISYIIYIHTNLFILIVNILPG